MVYNKFSEYLKKRYGTKVYKLPVNLSTSCPNRDGTIRMNAVGSGWLRDHGTDGGEHPYDHDIAMGAHAHCFDDTVDADADEGVYSGCIFICGIEGQALRRCRPRSTSGTNLKKTGATSARNLAPENLLHISKLLQRLPSLRYIHEGYERSVYRGDSRSLHCDQA